MTIQKVMAAVIGGLLLTGIAIAQDKPAIAIIGTGDMGDSLGPRFAELGYEVIYGSRDPAGQKAQGVLAQTG